VLTCCGLKTKATGEGFALLKPKFQEEFDLNRVGAGKRLYENAAKEKKTTCKYNSSQKELKEAPSIKKSVHTDEKIMKKIEDSYRPGKAVAIIENYNQFTQIRGKTEWVLDDKVIEFKDKTWIYRKGTGAEIKEGTVIKKYGQKVSTHTIDNKSFMQAHHGIQTEWAKERLGNKYNESEAPAILLRDSCKETPHQYITAQQNMREKTISKRTYADERDIAKKELNDIHVPQNQITEYLKEADTYFKGIYNEMLPEERIKIFGKKICNSWGGSK
jgi:hypothetical protein